MCLKFSICRFDGPRQEHNIWAGTFHSFWREIELKSATSSDRSPVDFKNLSDEEQTEVFLANLGDLDEEEFDALIIDEGQDFHSSWLEALELAVKDRGKGVVYMFHDNNQSVVPRSGSYIAKLDYFDFRLIKNLRNTRAIFRVVDRFYQSAEPVIPQGPQGSDVMWNPCKDVSEVRKLLVERTGYLINHHGLSPEEIAVLVPAQKMIEEIVPGGRLANHPIRSAEDFDGTGPIVDSIRRFKGLESTAVILVLTNSIRGEQEVLYTAVSRPRAILEVLAPRALINEIRTGLEEGA
jgi:superfamily I DNA/RNA helicase